MKLYQLEFTAERNKNKAEQKVYVFSESIALAKCDFYEHNRDKLLDGWKLNVTNVTEIKKRTYDFINVLY